MFFFLSINEQTNPSLSWGGKNLPLLEKIYSFSNLSAVETPSTLTSLNQTKHGTLEIKLGRSLTPGTVLNIHTNVIDELQCLGPSSVTKLKGNI